MLMYLFSIFVNNQISNCTIGLNQLNNFRAILRLHFREETVTCLGRNFYFDHSIPTEQHLYFSGSCMINLLVLNDFVFHEVCYVSHYWILQVIFPLSCSTKWPICWFSTEYFAISNIVIQDSRIQFQCTSNRLENIANAFECKAINPPHFTQKHISVLSRNYWWERNDIIASSDTRCALLT